MIGELQYVTSRDTGGHYAFVTKRGNVFKNKLTECKLVKLNSDDIVVDIGAYVGEYSLYAAKQGVKKVIAYEASPNTFEALEKNATDTIFPVNKAVVGTHDNTVTLHLAEGIGVTNSIAKSHGRKTSVEVPAINYTDAVREATVVKIDVEGAEYGYDIVQPHLRAIILEFHNVPNIHWKEKALQIMEDLEKAGFKALAKPEFQHGFDMHGAWIKDTQ